MKRICGWPGSTYGAGVAPKFGPNWIPGPAGSYVIVTGAEAGPSGFPCEACAVMRTRYFCAADGTGAVKNVASNKASLLIAGALTSEPFLTLTTVFIAFVVVTSQSAPVAPT